MVVGAGLPPQVIQEIGCLVCLCVCVFVLVCVGVTVTVAVMEVHKASTTAEPRDVRMKNPWFGPPARPGCLAARKLSTGRRARNTAPCTLPAEGRMAWSHWMGKPGEEGNFKGILWRASFYYSKSAPFVVFEFGSILCSQHASSIYLQLLI